MRNHFLFLILATALSTLLCGTVRAEPPAPPAGEAPLIEILRSEASLEQKADACRQLERVGTRQAIAVLAALLADEKLSHKARAALEQIHDPAVDEALRSAIPRLQGRLLGGVLQSIGHRRDGRAVEAITPCLKSTDPEVASSAAYALGLIGTAEAIKALQQSRVVDEVKPAVWDALLRAAEAQAAQGQRDAAVGLYDWLRASDAPVHVRAAAARGAVVARKTEGIALLNELFQHQDRTFFEVALRLAVELPSEAVTQTLASQVEKAAVDRRPLVIQALSNRADKAALPAIRDAMKQPETKIKVATIRALSDMEDKDALPLLLEAASSSEKSVSEAALAALVRLPGSEVDAAMIEWVRGSDTARSLTAIETLAKRQSALAGSALLAAATSGDQQVRLGAIKALGEIGSAAELQPLLNMLLKSSDKAEMDAAQQAIVSICASSTDKPACEQIVIEAFTGARQSQQKITLLNVLSSLGGAKSLETMRKASADADAQVQETAIRGLCNWSTVEVAPDLMNLARTGAKPAHRILAVRGWLRLASDARLPVEKRMEMCEQAVPLLQRPEEKRLWLAALSSIVTPASLNLISGQLTDPAVKEEACSAAVSVAGKLAHPSSTLADPASISAAMQQVKQTSRNARTVEAAEAVLTRIREKSGK